MYGGKVIGKLSDYNFAFLNAQAGTGERSVQDKVAVQQ